MKQNDDLRAVQAAKAAAANIKATAKALEDRHRTLSKDLERIIHADRAQEEVVAEMERLVDQAGAAFPADFGRTFVRQLSGHTELRGPGDARERVVRPRLPELPNGYLGHFNSLCALFPDLVKVRLREVIAQSGANFGLPAAARAAKVGELEAAIADVERLHTDLVDGAAEVGIELPLLPAVRERREAEALRLRREQELEAERARGLYRVAAGGPLGG